MTRRWVIWLRTSLVLLTGAIVMVGVKMQNGLDDDFLMLEGSLLFAAVCYSEWRFPINARRARIAKPAFFSMVFCAVMSGSFWLIDHHHK